MSKLLEYPNGYAAHIAPRPRGDGGEVAVMRRGPHGWEPTYDTHITGAVVWYFGDEELNYALRLIESLPPVAA